MIKNTFIKHVNLYLVEIVTGNLLRDPRRRESKNDRKLCPIQRK